MSSAGRHLFQATKMVACMDLVSFLSMSPSEVQIGGYHPQLYRSPLSRTIICAFVDLIVLLFRLLRRVIRDQQVYIMQTDI